jgi:hypothetical protein
MSKLRWRDIAAPRAPWAGEWAERYGFIFRVTPRGVTGVQLRVYDDADHELRDFSELFGTTLAAKVRAEYLAMTLDDANDEPPSGKRRRRRRDPRAGLLKAATALRKVMR